jgi:hypothetical protein
VIGTGSPLSAGVSWAAAFVWYEAEKSKDITAVICRLAGLAYTLSLYTMKPHKLFIQSMLLGKS